MSFMFPSLSRRFVPTVLQMVQVHYSLCTYSILFCLHPLSIWLLFFLFALFTCAMYTHGFWSVGLHMWQTSNKCIIITEDQSCATKKLFIYICFAVNVFFLFVYLGAQWTPTRWVGRLQTIKRISKAADGASSQTTVCIPRSLTHLQGVHASQPGQKLKKINKKKTGQCTTLYSGGVLLKIINNKLTRIQAKSNSVTLYCNR